MNWDTRYTQRFRNTAVHLRNWSSLPPCPNHSPVHKVQTPQAKHLLSADKVIVQCAHSTHAGSSQGVPLWTLPTLSGLTITWEICIHIHSYRYYSKHNHDKVVHMSTSQWNFQIWHQTPWQIVSAGLTSFQRHIIYMCIPCRHLPHNEAETSLCTVFHHRMSDCKTHCKSNHCKVSSPCNSWASCLHRTASQNV